MYLSRNLFSSLLILSTLFAITSSFTSFSIISPVTRSTSTNLFGGTGITNTYSWKEDQYEIELKVKVPKETKAKDITYKPKSKSIHLSINDKVLLDGTREMRGLIDLDGTFWSLVDSEEHDGRDVIITIEKLILPPKDPFEVVEFDWNGIYPDDEDEIIKKEYKEPEELDVREYAKSLGVDIDNINMTLVDKNMFSSGLNMTRNTLDELTSAGYVSEVTRQSDGTELINKGSESVPFNAFGQNVGRDEIDDAGIDMNGIPAPTMTNPYMTPESPWLQTMPAEEARTGEESVEVPSTSTKKDSDKPKKLEMKDPIDLLTVSKLKEVLRNNGLKVSGNKSELQARLKEHVKSVLEEKKDDESWQ